MTSISPLENVFDRNACYLMLGICSFVWVKYWLLFYRHDAFTAMLLAVSKHTLSTSISFSIHRVGKYLK